jgi:hypothetical protein
MDVKLDIKKILQRIKIGLASTKKILWVVGRHAFLAVLILIFLNVILGGFLFYKYIYLAEKESMAVDTPAFQFDENSYQKVLIQWESRDKNLQEFLQKNYSNPF